MADLPEGVLTKLLSTAAESHQFMMQESQGNIQNANQIARGAVTKKFDETGAAEAGSDARLIATPAGEPVTKVS
jgi:hypothetical protein